MIVQWRFRAVSSLALLSTLLILPASSHGQSREELRKEEVRAKLAQMEFQQEARMARIQETLARIQEELAVQEGQSREAVAARLAQIEEALALAKDQAGDARVEAQHRLQEILERAQQSQEKAQQLRIQVRSRVRLGVSLVGTQDEETDQQGALVQDVMMDSPAEKAGLMDGDIITHVDGHHLLDALPGDKEEDLDAEASLPVQRLMALAQELEDGQEVEIRYLREGSPETTVLEAAEMEDPNVIVLRGDRGPRGVVRMAPDAGNVWTFSDPDRKAISLHLSEMEGLKRLEESGEFPRILELAQGGSRFGVEVTMLNPALGSYFSTEEGVLVLAVEDDSPLNLVPGDVIQAVDGRTVGSERALWRILRSYDAQEAFTLTVVRQGRSIDVEGTLG